MRFSVIIPLYNKASYVPKAIESVLNQTFHDFELIVVDDGSTDGSADVANSYHDSRFMFIKQENAGVSMARNNGAAVAAAPYLCFLDADDWWEPTFLEEMDSLIKAYPDAGIYATNYNYINETKHKTRVSPVGVENGFERGYIDYCKTYHRNLAMPLWTGAVCIPKAIYDEMGGFPKGIKLGEDFILWIHVALKYKVVFLNKPLSNYNQDVEVKSRAVGHLHQPKHHMLWNLRDLEPIEQTNEGYKQLIDKLRVTGLMQYFISPLYHDAAAEELTKVDWSNQPSKVKHEYDTPVLFLRCKADIMRLGATMKTILRQIAKKM